MPEKPLPPEVAALDMMMQSQLKSKNMVKSIAAWKEFLTVLAEESEEKEHA